MVQPCTWRWDPRSLCAAGGAPRDHSTDGRAARADTAVREDDEMLGTVVQVVDGGRGFLIETKKARYVVTAAHCLKECPPAHAASYTSERTYPRFLGALNGPCDVW